MTGYVYAIGCGDRVKIGFSTNPASRLVKLKTDNDRETELLGVVPATVEQEAQLHAILAPWRIRGEWFLRGPHAVESFIFQLMPVQKTGRARSKELKGPLAGCGVSATKLAAVLGVGKSDISKWQRARVPSGRVLDVERATGISRHIIRPDLYPRDEVAA